MTTETLEAWLEKLKRMRAGFEQEGPMPTDAPIGRSANATWLEPEVTGNPSRIGVLFDVPAKTMDFYLQEIPAGGSTDLQRHVNESVHYVIEGSGYSEIGPDSYGWGTGDFVYTPPWIWHRHYNSGEESVRMLIVENSGVLEHLGINRRESVGLMTYSEYMAQRGEAQ
jgi:quercetin dioxygenase-like cupin family protein